MHNVHYLFIAHPVFEGEETKGADDKSVEQKIAWMKTAYNCIKFCLIAIERYQNRRSVINIAPLNHSKH